MNKLNKITEIDFYGIRFLNGDYKEIKNEFKKGGLMVVPSAPGLNTIKKDKIYFNAIKKSKFAILDSGYFCLLLRLIKKINVKKFSGLKFLRCFLFDKTINKNKLFLINPSKEDSYINKVYLKSIGINIKDNYYNAPIYNINNIKDNNLIKILKKKKPNYIIINVGGGIQEPLGQYIITKLNFKTSIFCTGAAIAFLTGRQANIPEFFDYIYLGWLLRSLNNPKNFIKRYLGSFSLISLIVNSKPKIKWS